MPCDLEAALVVGAIREELDRTVRVVDQGRVSKLLVGVASDAAAQRGREGRWRRWLGRLAGSNGAATNTAGR